MNNYWSNEDDKKVSYTSDQPPYRPQPGAQRRNGGDTAGSFPAGRRASRHDAAETPAPEPSKSNPYGGNRSSFIAEEMNKPRTPGEMQFAPPPKFSETYGEGYKPLQQEIFQYGDGYQVRSEQTPYPRSRHRKRGFFVFLIILLVLVLLGGGAYLFRHEILQLIGNVFGEEVMQQLSPTEAPVEETPDVAAYVESTAPRARNAAMREIEALTQGVPLETYMVTDGNVVLREDKQDGAFDYYLFTADTGMLLGYYENIRDFNLCAQDIFYTDAVPYLITSAGYPLADLEEYARSAGEGVVISPMINGWATIANRQGTMFNFIGTDGNLISDLWFSKTFPFTADATLGYVDTGNVTDTQTRYALYLLYQNGETKRLDYVANTDDVMQSACGMAFMQNGDMREQDEDMTYVLNTDAVSAYVNCGALAVRDPETGLYGLFVEGVQQYPFAFDSIEPMTSDLQWSVSENGYVKIYTVTGKPYPLPRSYSFVLTSGGTKQIVSIASTSEYPIVFD